MRQAPPENETQQAISETAVHREISKHLHTGTCSRVREYVLYMLEEGEILKTWLAFLARARAAAAAVQRGWENCQRKQTTCVQGVQLFFRFSVAPDSRVFDAPLTA